MKIPRVHQVRRILREQKVCGDAEMPIGMILVYSAFIGEDETFLAKHTKLRLSKVRLICSNLKRNGVFGKNIDHHKDYMSGADSGISLALDISCGIGYLKRSIKNGEAAYQMTDDGKDYVENDLLPQAKRK